MFFYYGNVVLKWLSHNIDFFGILTFLLVSLYFRHANVSIAAYWPIYYMKWSTVGAVLFLFRECACCSLLVLKLTRSLFVFYPLVHSHSRPVTCCWDWTSQRCSATWLLWIKWLQVSQHLNTRLGSVSYTIVGIPQPRVCGCWVQTAGLVYLYFILSVQISAWAAIRRLADTLHPTVIGRLSRCPVRRHWVDPPSCCKTNFAVW